MPQLTTAQIYNAAIPAASASHDVDFWSNPPSSHLSHFRRRPIIGQKSRPRKRGRSYRAWFWGLAAGLKTLGILGAFLLAIRAGWLGTAVLAATLAGLSLRYVLEATSQGD